MLTVRPVPEEAAPATVLSELQAIGDPCFDSASVHMERGFAVLSFSSSTAVRAALKALRGQTVLGQKVKVEWQLPPTTSFSRFQDAGEAVAESTKAGGLVPLRRSAGGELEALLAVQSRKLAKWEKQRGLGEEVLSILGGRRPDSESVIECVAREFFEETGGVLGPRGYDSLRAALSKAFEAGDGQDCFGAWLQPGKFVVLFANEALIPPASSKGAGELLEAWRAAETSGSGTGGERHGPRDLRSPCGEASPESSRDTAAGGKGPDATSAAAAACSGAGDDAAASGAGETVRPPSPPSDRTAPTEGIQEAMDGTPRETKAALGAVFNETSVVQWVGVGALLGSVRPPESGPVTYGSPSKLGAVFATSASGKNWRIGHFLTMALMEPAVRRRLEAMVGAPRAAARALSPRESRRPVSPLLGSNKSLQPGDVSVPS